MEENKYISISNSYDFKYDFIFRSVITQVLTNVLSFSSQGHYKYKKKIPLIKKPIKIFKKIITVVIGGVPIPLLVEAKVLSTS